MDEFIEKWDRKPIRLKQMIHDIRCINPERFDCCNLVNRLDKIGFKIDMDHVVVPASECKQVNPSYYRVSDV